MPDLLLNVSAVRRQTRTNGPGLRAAVWVQGCTLRCPGCFNPQTHAHEARQLLGPEELARSLCTPHVEGISILGGEPFEQAEASAALARAAQACGASVVTYSGYTRARLEASRVPGVQALLAATDLLIAGPFVASLANDGKGWHGSTNQELVFLTDRYDRRIMERIEGLSVVEVWTDGRVADWSGIAGEGALGDILDGLR